MESDLKNSPRHAEFIERFVRSQSKIYGFIAAMIANRADTEEIFQQTCLVLWKKWDQYDAEREFLAWACGIARNEVREFLRSRRNGKLHLSEALMERLADLQLREAQKIDHRLDALDGCMEQLPADQRALLERCYLGSEKIQAIAESQRIQPKSLYKRLDRIRAALMQCIERQTAVEDRP